MQIAAVEQMDIKEGRRGSRKLSFLSIRRLSQAPVLLVNHIREKQQRKWQECAMNSKVFNALKPLMLTCYAAGLLFRVDFRRDGLKKYLTGTHIYSFLIMIFLAANFIRYFMIFDRNEQFGTFFFMKLITSVNTIECFAHFVCFYVASLTYKRLPEFFIEWEKIHPRCSTTLTSVKRRACVITAMLWVLILFMAAMMTYFIFWTTMQDMYLVPLNATHQQVNTMKAVNLVVGIFHTIAWLTPSAFMFMIVDILSQEFTSITRYIKEFGDSDITKLTEYMERIRRYHQRLCNLVGHADDIFSMQIAVTFCGSFCMTCLITYVIIYGELTSGNRVLIITIQAFWLVMSLGKMVMDCISGAMLNGAVSMGCMYPDSKVHGDNMGTIWGRQDPDGPHVGPMNLAIWVCFNYSAFIVDFKLLTRAEFDNNLAPNNR